MSSFPTGQHKGGAARLARPRDQRSAGFALILVLWVMVLLGLIVSAIISTTRTRHDLSAHAAAQATAKAIAEGGIYSTIHSLLARDGALRFGEVRSVPVGRGLARVRIGHEGGKVDLVTAPPALLVALLEQCGLDQIKAQDLSAQIVRLRRATGPSPALTGLGDLIRFTALTPADGLQLQPVATVHSGSPEPLAPFTAPVQAAWADWLDLSLAERRSAAKRRPDRTIGRSHDLVEIRSAAPMGQGADYVVTAVVRLLSGTSTPFTILSWERGYSDPGPLAGGAILTCQR